MPEVRIRPLEPFGLSVAPSSINALGELDPQWLSRRLQRFSLVLFRGFRHFDRDGMLKFCGSFPGAELLHWGFGPVMEMREHPDAANYLFSNEAVPFHWDGAFHRVPSFLVFHCLEAPPADAGGETLFADTTRLWREADGRSRELWNRLTLTYETEKVAHYGGSITGPLVQRHPRRDRTILRYAEPVTTALNPVSLKVDGLSANERDSFVTAMGERLRDPRYCYRHRWEPGDFLIADNHALVHGRNAFTRGCSRHLRRIQIL